MSKSKPSWKKTNIGWEARKTIYQQCAKGETIQQIVVNLELKGNPLDRNTVSKVLEELDTMPPEMVRSLVEEVPEETKQFILQRRPDSEIKEKEVYTDSASRDKDISELNWIEQYEHQHGKLPTLPTYLVHVVNNYTPGEPVSKDIEPITPSGQWWNRRIPSEQKQWQQLVEWLGKDPEDLLALMRMTLPRNPSLRAKWKPFEQH